VAYAYLEQGAVAATVATAVRAALAELLAEEDASGDPNPEADFGWYFKDEAGAYEGLYPLDRVAQAIAGVSGIRKLGTPADGEGLTVGGVEDDVTLFKHQFPAAGTLRLINGDTGADIYNGAIL
jgi:hypothetical protein